MGFLFLICLTIVIIAMVQDLMIAAIIAICSGIFSFIIHSQNKKDIEQELSKINAIPILRIHDIVNICNTVREEMGTGGYFNMMVEIEGSIKTGNIQAYRYEGSVTNLYRVKDDILYVEDGTGRILIKTNKLSSFIDRNGGTLNKQNKPTAKVTMVEDLYGTVYVVGEASDASGELIVQKPKDFTNPFFVAFSSRKEFMQHKEKPKWGAKASGIIFLSLGNICLLIEIMKMLGYY
jgi:MFS superfamily sulfate permease-like transporter